MMTKMNSSYMHTRYSYLCVWTYEEESSNETISLGQYIDRRFKVLFIDYHTGTILLYAFFSIHSSHENEPLLWGYVYLLLARNSFPRFFRILSLFPLYYPSVNSIIVIFQTLGRSIFGEVFLVEIKSWKDLVSHILVGNVQHSFQKRMLTITNDWTKQHVITFPSFFSAAAWKKTALKLFKEYHLLPKILWSRLNRLHDSLSALLDVSTSRRLLHDLQSYARQSNFNSSILLILSARNNLSRILNRKFSMQVSWSSNVSRSSIFYKYRY